tara:strand:- start:6845 stop:7558 length:714 start_codon:yes stop_codon:yes gene_type:complete
MNDNTDSIAFVAGSTGYVGQALVRALCEQGVTTIAHIRPGSSKLARLGPVLEGIGATVDTTPWDVDALTKTLKRFNTSHVFCLIGTTRKQASAEGIEGDIYERIDLGLTSMLVDAAAKQARPPRFVYLSSIGAKADAGSKYLQARGKAEAKLIASGLSHVIARPSFITGSDRDESRPAERIGAAVADGALSLAGLVGGKRLKKKYQSTSASKLAKRLIGRGLGQSNGVFEGSDLSQA